MIIEIKDNFFKHVLLKFKNRMEIYFEINNKIKISSVSGLGLALEKSRFFF